MAGRGNGDAPDRKKLYILGGIGGLLALVIGLQVVNRMRNAPPPLAPGVSTHDRLKRLTSAINAFVAEQQRLPSTVEEGAGMEKTMDGWNRPFTLTPGTEGSKKVSFVLRSSGADGTPDNEDDQYCKVKFGNDGYGKLGVEATEFVPTEVE